MTKTQEYYLKNSLVVQKKQKR